MRKRHPVRVTTCSSYFPRLANCDGIFTSHSSSHSQNSPKRGQIFPSPPVTHPRQPFHVVEQNQHIQNCSLDHSLPTCPRTILFPAMSVSPDQAELDELLAPPIESVISKALREVFPWSRGLLAAHLPLDPTTLEVLCRVNLPKIAVRRDSNNNELDFTDYGLERTIELTCQPLSTTKPEQSPDRLRLTVRQCNSYLNAVKSMRMFYGQRAARAGVSMGLCTMLDLGITVWKAERRPCFFGCA